MNVIEPPGPAAPPQGPGSGLRLLWQHRGSATTGATFAAGVALPRLAGLLTVPIYTRLLGPAGFGAFEIIVSLVALLYALCLLGMDFAISVRYFDSDATARRADSSSAVAAAAATSGLVALALMVASVLLAPRTFASEIGAPALLLAAAAIPFNVIGGVLAMSIRLRFDARAFFAAMFLGSAAGTLVGALAVLAGWGIVGAILGILLTHVSTFALLWRASRGTVDRSLVARGRVRALVRIGLPLVPGNASTWVFAVADRFFILALFGLYEVGLYAAASRLATGLGLIQYGYLAAWSPLALRWSTLPSPDVRYAASLRAVAVVGGAGVAIVGWFAEPLLWFLAGPSYVAAADVVWMLAGGVLFSAMFYTVQIGASVAQRAGRIAFATILAAGINTAANVALIPGLGYMGAGIATILAYLVAYAVMAALSQQVRPYRLEITRSTAWAVGWTLVAALSQAVAPDLRAAGGVVVTIGATILVMRTVTQSVSRATAGATDTTGPA